MLFCPFGAFATCCSLPSSSASRACRSTSSSALYTRMTLVKSIVSTSCEWLAPSSLQCSTRGHSWTKLQQFTKRSKMRKQRPSSKSCRASQAHSPRSGGGQMTKIRRMCKRMLLTARRLNNNCEKSWNFRWVAAQIQIPSMLQNSWKPCTTSLWHSASFGSQSSMVSSPRLKSMSAGRLRITSTSRCGFLSCLNSDALVCMTPSLPRIGAWMRSSSSISLNTKRNSR
mmetsp:Transcript_56474/g.106412  ORF Transcript_56474/g.106412 Transcript_56474/m.106412 type:complete len:227 (+) Transcript_56474:1154-1834(+)